MNERMEKVIENLETNYSEVRAGRANPAILNRVTVEYYGAPSPINQVASVSVPEARLIVIQPWDRTLLSQIWRAVTLINKTMKISVFALIPYNVFSNKFSFLIMISIFQNVGIKNCHSENTNVGSFE